MKARQRNKEIKIQQPTYEVNGLSTKQTLQTKESEFHYLEFYETNKTYT